MKICNMNDNWRDLRIKIKHELGYYSDEEMNKRKGTPLDLISNLKKIWGRKSNIN